MNPIYIPSVKTLLATENCVGIIGGRPKHSLYFVGFQEDNLIHLDPHLVQESVNVVSRHNFPLDSFHCKTPRKMPISRMDPSCCLGFYCANKKSFDGWAELMGQLAVPTGTTSNYPMFSVVEGRAEDHQISYMARQQELEQQQQQQRVRRSLEGTRDEEENNGISEDFIFL